MQKSCESLQFQGFGDRLKVLKSSKFVSLEAERAAKRVFRCIQQQIGEGFGAFLDFRKKAMNAQFTEMILQRTGATGFEVEESLQELWSGYGQILRLTLEGAGQSTAVAKWMALPNQNNHPRGWDTDRSHQRKVRSYEVEAHWYQHYNSACGDSLSHSSSSGSPAVGGRILSSVRRPGWRGFSASMLRSLTG